MTKIVNGKIEAGASIISLINEGGNEEETNKLHIFYLVMTANYKIA